MTRSGGWHHTSEACAKISAAKRGRPRSRATRAKISASKRGQPLTVEHCRRISEGGMGRIPWNKGLTKANDPRLSGPTHNDAVRAGMAGCLATRRYRGPTWLELALRRLLQEAGFHFEEQKSVGRHVVDAFVPSHRLVFEADCSFWHRGRDEKTRDAALMEAGIAAVVHLTETDLRPWKGRVS